MPVHLVTDGEGVGASAFRLVDLQRKYHWAPAGLAAKLKITQPRATALRAHLGIDHDDASFHVFDFGGAQKIRPILRQRLHQDAERPHGARHGRCLVFAWHCANAAPSSGVQPAWLCRSRPGQGRTPER